MSKYLPNGPRLVSFDFDNLARTQLDLLPRGRDLPARHVERPCVSAMPGDLEDNGVPARECPMESGLGVRQRRGPPPPDVEDGVHTLDFPVRRDLVVHAIRGE